MSVWWQGGARSERDAPWAAERGLLLGDGLFETVLVAAGVPRHLDRHLARMAHGAAVLGFALPPTLVEDVGTAVPELLRAEADPARAALRITVSRGVGHGLEPAADARSAALLTLRALVDGPLPPARACVVDRPRIDPESPLAGLKTLSHLPYVLARAEARRRGADVALLRTLAGDVCEADAANLFAVLDGVVVTPPLDRGVLPGITRARCLEQLRSEGTAVEERPLEPADLASGSEVFLTSSLAGVRPVASVDAHAVAAPGPVALRLAACSEPGAGT